MVTRIKLHTIHYNKGGAITMKKLQKVLRKWIQRNGIAWVRENIEYIMDDIFSEAGVIRSSYTVQTVMELLAI